MIPLVMPPALETERLMLQRLRYEDAEEIFYAYASKPEATRFVSWPTHTSVDDTRAYLAGAVQGWNAGKDYAYSIRLKNGMLIGSIGAVYDEGHIQLGYVISPARWGRGYATEACAALLAVLTAAESVRSIGTFVDADNTGSVRVLQKCGMKEEARLEKWFRFVNQGNQQRDCILFRLI